MGEQAIGEPKDGLARHGDVAADEPVTVRALVARNLARLRLDGAASRDEILQAARRRGLSWTGTWLSAVERGQREMTAGQLLALPMVLSDVLKYRVGLADLLLGGESVLLGSDVVPATGRGKKAAPPVPAAPVSAGYLRETLTASPYSRAFSIGDSAVAPNAAPESPLSQAAAKMREITAAGFGNVDVRALARAEAGAGDLEERLARRLGVAPIVVIAAAASLWGRSAVEERDARLRVVVAEDAPRPATVTRRITGDLVARIDEAAAPPEEPPAAAPPEAATPERVAVADTAAIPDQAAVPRQATAKDRPAVPDQATVPRHAAAPAKPAPPPWAGGHDDSRWTDRAAERTFVFDVPVPREPSPPVPAVLAGLDEKTKLLPIVRRDPAADAGPQRNGGNVGGATRAGDVPVSPGVPMPPLERLVATGTEMIPRQRTSAETADPETADPDPRPTRADRGPAGGRGLAVDRRPGR